MMRPALRAACDSVPLPVVQRRAPSPDPSGRMQVVECADDVTGARVFVVYDGVTVLRLCATHEQSFAYLHGLLGATPGRSPDTDATP